MPDENRVFDVAKPGHSSPEATSKPVIVGHHPTTSDPMVKDDADMDSEPTRITVHDQNRLPTSEASADSRFSTESKTEEPAGNSWDSPADQPLIPLSEESKPDWETPTADAESHIDASSDADSSITSPDGNTTPDGSAATDSQSEQPPIEPIGHVEGLHVSPPRRRLSMKWVALSLLILVVGAYLLIDSGALGSSINLPFHVFKQRAKTPPVAAPAVSSNKTNTNASTASVPSGFTEYKLAGTSLTFAAPTAWGDPTSTTDPGFSTRSATAKTDGTYAYLVDFATNKDVEIAVTSSQYLSTARSQLLYYDFLQWCTGTNDAKTYQSILHFSTANKVDTPTTITCDQGPLADATKLDTSTIVQLKTKDVGGTVLGDLYTKNLNSSDLPVFRVKDKAMTNGSVIKTLLSTVKSPTGTAVTK